MANGTIYLSNGHPPGPRVMAVPGPLRPEAADDATDGSSNQRPHEPETNGAKTNGAKPISQAKLEANRRNAQQSTGPRTEEGKGTSSMNAVKHGLLAEGVITRGDYREDPIEYLELLEFLRKQHRVKGPVEELEVEQMALQRWRKKRAVRFEVGTIAQRTMGMRRRAERRRKERVEEELNLGPGVVEMLEQHAAGVKHILDVMRAVRTDPSSGTPPGHDLEWLIAEYPADFTPEQPHERDAAGDSARPNWGISSPRCAPILRNEPTGGLARGSAGSRMTSGFEGRATGMQVGPPHHFVRNEPTVAGPARGRAGRPVTSRRRADRPCDAL